MKRPASFDWKFDIYGIMALEAKEWHEYILWLEGRVSDLEKSLGLKETEEFLRAD